MAAARDSGESGLALGAWGAAQATAAGIAIAAGGVLRDVIAERGASGALGEVLSDPSVPYSVVYHIEILVLFVALVALGPLVRRRRESADQQSSNLGFAGVTG
jgi:BCD family chlorophyll transporter-like MFS transporter